MLDGSAERVLRWHVIVLGWPGGPAEGWRSLQFKSAVMGTAVLDAGQSSCAAWLLPFLASCWSLMTPAAVPSEETEVKKK